MVQKSGANRHISYCGWVRRRVLRCGHGITEIDLGQPWTLEPCGRSRHSGRPRGRTRRRFDAHRRPGSRRAWPFSHPNRDGCGAAARADARPIRGCCLGTSQPEPAAARRGSLARNGRPPDTLAARVGLPAGASWKPDRRDHGRLRRPGVRPGGGLQRSARHGGVPTPRRRPVRRQGERPLPAPVVDDVQRQRRDEGGRRQCLQDRDRRLRVHRLRGREAAGEGGRWGRRDPRPCLLRPGILGRPDSPGMGTAGRDEPPRFEPGAHLCPVAKGRQRLRPGAAAATARHGGPDQGAVVGHRQTAASPEGCRRHRPDRHSARSRRGRLRHRQPSEAVECQPGRVRAASICG